MNCQVFEEILPEIIDGDGDGDGGGTPEQMAHLTTCTDCATLWADLRFIADEAAALPADYEPVTDLWPGIALQLQQEGVIRPQSAHGEAAGATVIPFVRPATASTRVRPGFSAKWLMPLAAMLVLGLGTYMAVLSGTSKDARVNTPVRPAAASDESVLSHVAAQSPEKASRLRTHLQQVNAYIAAAKHTVDTNPNDAEASEALRDAYNQKAMVYEVAYADSGQ